MVKVFDVCKLVICLVRPTVRLTNLKDVAHILILIINNYHRLLEKLYQSRFLTFDIKNELGLIQLIY